MNMTPHTSLKRETPFQILHGEEADLSHLRIIGARAFVYIKDSRKVDTVAWEGKVCGYIEKNKSYRVWNLKTHQTSPLSRDRCTCYPRLQSPLRCKSW